MNHYLCGDNTLVKPHSWTRRKDKRLINPEFLDILDQYAPDIPGWEITQRDKGYISRQIKLETLNPDIKAVINLYTNGTAHMACSPKIHVNEFNDLVDKFRKLCEGIESYLSKKPTEKKEFEIPGIA